MAGNDPVWYIVIGTLSVAGIMATTSADRLELLLIAVAFSLLIPVLYYVVDLRLDRAADERLKEEIYRDAASRAISQRSRRRQLSMETARKDR